MTTIGSLCTGYGGLDMAAAEVLGGEVAWVADNDPASWELLAYRYPDAPNHGDITTVSWHRADPVDVLTAGWPCQPFSVAGKRRGAEDERAIWPAVARAVRDLRPRLVLLENVAAVVPSGELARAVGDLAALGYVGSWRCLRAADVGAPHRRDRLFIAARDTDRVDRDRRSPAGLARQARPATRPAAVAAAATPDADLARREGTEPAQGRDVPARGAAPDAESDRRREGLRRADAAVCGSRAAPDAHGDGLALVGEGPEPHARHDTDGCGPRGAWGPYTAAIRRWERVIGRPAPAPTQTGARGGQQLSPTFVEFLMGLPEGWVTAVPGLTRNEQLRRLGEGVVPQQAAAAIRALLPTLKAVAA